MVFQAYEIFAQKEFVKEQVFVLGRMGNAKEALSTIINKLEDIQEVLTWLSSFSYDILCCVTQLESMGLD